MFDRYDESARRAIFFARYSALARDAQAIEVGDLIVGLTREAHAENCPFRPLYERRQELAELMETPIFESPASWPPPGPDRQIPLSVGSKTALARAAVEVRNTKCYWLDRAHLQIGIMEASERALFAFGRVGYTLDATRSAAREARKKWPGKRPSLKRRLKTFPWRLWFVLGALVGFFAGLVFAAIHNN